MKNISSKKDVTALITGCVDQSNVKTRVTSEPPAIKLRRRN